MKAAVERHDDIMRRAIEAHGGSVFRIMGDAFCASFPIAPQALLAALDAQKALHSETWDPALAPIRVRMALHTGIGEVRDGDYVGTPLNRVARLLSTGYGGQTLLSRSVYDLVRYNLPDGLVLRDLGEHHLKDLSQAEHVFQVVTPDLLSDFPPLKSLENRPNNLPTQPTPLIGRRDELVSICALVKRPDTRLVTLTGPGGIGKTRLALQAAADLLDDFDDGVFLVPLAPLTDPTLLAQTIVQALGIRDIGGKPTVEGLKEYLRNKQILLVLDNFEQVVSGAPVVAELLAACPEVKALVASREVLHIRGEKECEVPPLALPDTRNLPPPEELARYDSVALFVQRAQDVRADFQLTVENSAAVAEICRRLDGLPLAIELAAARIKVLSPHAMLERLRSRLTLLTGGARDLPARQQTLRNTIAWSYDLLPPAEQVLFRRLAVFVGGFSLDAAEEICNFEFSVPQSESPEERTSTQYSLDVLEGLIALTDKSLVRREESWGGDPRFMMLETIQEFARQMLEEHGEFDEMRKRHADYFTDIAYRMGPGIMSNQRTSIITVLETEHDNLRAVLEWCTLSPERYDQGLRIAADLTMFWDYRDAFMSEGRGWLAKMLTLTEGADRTGLRGNALMGAGLLSMALGDYGPAHDWLEQSRAICEEVGDHSCVAMSTGTLALTYQLSGDSTEAIKLASEAREQLQKFDSSAFRLVAPGIERSGIADSPYSSLPPGWGLAFVSFVLGDANLSAGNYEAARRAHNESLDVYRKLGIDEDATLPMTSLGKLAILEGNYDEARKLLEESLAIRRKGNTEWFVGISLTTLSDLARYEGDYDRVEKLAQEGLKIFVKLNNNGGIAWARYNLACAALHRGDLEPATALFRESLLLRREQGNATQIAEDLLGLAEVSAERGELKRTTRLLGAVGSIIDEGARLDKFEKDAFDRDTVEVRLRVGEAEHYALWDEGHAMAVDRAVEYALHDTDTS